MRTNKQNILASLTNWEEYMTDDCINRCDLMMGRRDNKSITK